MRLKFKPGVEETVKELVDKHIFEAKPLDAKACIFIARLPKNLVEVKKTLTESQRTIVSLRAEYVLGEGRNVDPLLFSQVPQKEISFSDNKTFVEETASKLGCGSNDKNMIRLLAKCAQLSTENELLGTLKLYYGLTVLGTGELNENYIPALAN